MIVALLVLIVLIMLFGAGVVTGWLTNILGAVLGFALLVGVILWAGSYFGENGPEYVIWGGIAVLLLLVIWVKATETIEGTEPTVARSRDVSHRPVPKPSDQAARMWARFAPVLGNRLSPQDRAKVNEMIRANDHLQLTWRCKNYVREVYGEDAGKVLSGCGFR